MDKEKFNRLWEITCTVSLAVVYSYFVYKFSIDFIHTQRISSLIMVAFESLYVWFILVRAMPKKISMSSKDWFIAIFGTFLPLLFRPDESAVNDLIFLQILQLTGVGLSAFGLLMLNKSFGLVAANRGVKKNGIYKIIRHPIYAGYFLSFTMFVLQNFTARNIIIIILFFCFSVLRIFAEEKFLSQDFEYAEYMTTTKWRILPYIF